MRDHFGLSLWNSNIMDCYISSKDSLLHIQVHLTDPCIETSKGGQLETNRGGEMEGGLRWITDTALQLGAHNWAQPEEGQNQVVAGAPFIQEEQRNLVGILTGVSSVKSGWAQRLWQGHNMGVLLWLSISFHSRHRKKGIEPCHPEDSQNSPPFALSVGLQSTLFAKLRTGTTESYFSLSKGCTLWPILGWVTGGASWSSEVAITGKSKQRSWQDPPAHPNPHEFQLCWCHSEMLWGQHWDFTELNNLWFSATYWKIREISLCNNLPEKCHSYIDN